MKHIKLFEQWDDPFGEDSITNDDINIGDNVILINNQNAILSIVDDDLKFVDSSKGWGWIGRVLDKKTFKQYKLIRIGKFWYDSTKFVKE